MQTMNFVLPQNKSISFNCMLHTMLMHNICVSVYLFVVAVVF